MARARAKQFLTKTNGAKARTSQVVSGTNGIRTPVDPNTYTHDAQPIIIVGPGRWPGPDSTTSQDLTADGLQGASSVTIANASGFTPGQFVLLDELSGASWQAVPPGFGCSNNAEPMPCPPFVWQGDRIAWNMHYPKQMFISTTIGPQMPQDRMTQLLVRFLPSHGLVLPSQCQR